MHITTRTLNLHDMYSNDYACISLRHDVNENKVAALSDEMAENGWTGRPVVMAEARSGMWRNVTGCHRLCAGERAEVEIPIVLVRAESPGDDDDLTMAWSDDDDGSARALREWPEVSDLVAQG